MKGTHRQVRRTLVRFLLGGFLVFLALLVAAGTTGLVVLNNYAKELPDVSRLRYYEPSETTRIFSSDGQLIATLFKENRTWTPLEDISPNMRNAILAIEDSRFYEHKGVDPVGVLRAGLDLIRSRGQIRQGASTITMQLARNLFLSPDQSFDRKFREALLALQIEKTFAKDEILELYLNQVYFGAGAYGVQAAANVYFNTKASDLSVVQAAIIAGLPASPSTYSPLVDERSARIRAIEVLSRMLVMDQIDQKQYREAVDQLRSGLKYANKNREEFQVLKVPYFTTYVIKELYSRYDEDLLYRGGLRIYTTVDLKLQEQAESILRRDVANYASAYNATNAAAVVIENKTGYIRAMVGGVGWSKKNQFNRAWQARRQPGSSFKVFVYTTAVEAGYTPDTVVPDSPVTYQMGGGETWSPKNSDGRFMGSIPMRTALQYSRNVVAVRLLTLVGAERVIEYAYRMGIRERLEPNLSLALGSAVVTPLEMASAFSVFPNGGLRIEPTGVKIIYDSEGNVVEDHTFPKQEEVLSEATAFTMSEMLQNAVERGTGTAALLSDRPVAGKTGTTDDHRDGWFVGFTPQYTSAVWVGNDNFSRMWHVFGGDVAAPLFRQIMQFAHKGLPVLQFGQLRGGQVSVLMCSESKKRANAKCPTTYKEYFKPGMVPTAFCPLHGRGQALPLANPSPQASKSPDKKEDSKEEVPVETDPQPELPSEAPTAVPLEAPTQEPILDLPPVDGSETGPTQPEQPTPIEMPQEPPQEGDLPPAATPEPLPTSALP